MKGSDCPDLQTATNVGPLRFPGRPSVCSASHSLSEYRRRNGLRISKIRLLTLICLLSFFVNLPPKTSGQGSDPQGPNDPMWQIRFDLFEKLLTQQGLTRTSRPMDVFEAPPDSVIVLLGGVEPAWTGNYLMQFVRRGGRVLIATESRCQVPGLLQTIPGPVRVTEPTDQYQSNPDCPVISKLSESSPLTAGVQSLVMNRCGVIRSLTDSAGRWQMHGYLPSSTGESLHQGMPVIASTGTGNAADDGTAILTTDSSLFSNGMLWHGDNAVFALNVAKALTAGNRSRLYFALSRDMEQFSGSHPVRSASESPVPPVDVPPAAPDQMPEPDAEMLLDMANDVIDGFNDPDVANEFLLDRPRNMATRNFRRAVLFAVLIGCLVLLCIYLFKPASGVTWPGTGKREMRNPAEILMQHYAGHSGRRNALRRMAQESCCRLTGTTDPQRWKPIMRQIAARESSFLARRRRLKDADRLTSLALGLLPRNISDRLIRQTQESVGRFALAAATTEPVESTVSD